MNYTNLSSVCYEKESVTYTTNGKRRKNDNDEVFTRCRLWGKKKKQKERLFSYDPSMLKPLYIGTRIYY